MTDGVVTKYYFAGGTRIAMRKAGTLYYMLSDHLGSTSIVTFENGNLLSQTKYKAWGEVRHQSGPSMTEYTYTGQYSYTADFGLMYYNARWYDPSLGRFAQADSIVPPGVHPHFMGAGGLDRYAYVNNSPMNYVDPSGHVTCEGANWDDGPKCTQKSKFWQKVIKDTFDWDADSDFSLEELKTIYQTGRDIEKYVDDLTGGMGLEWMNFFLGGVNIVNWNGSNNQALPFPLFGSETTIKLNGSWISGADPKRWLAHEFGHIWDINTAHATTAAGAIGGVGDDLNVLIGGSIATGPHTKSRFGNIYPASPYIPEAFLYRRGSYANTSTADYLAETFALSIYHPNEFNKPELQMAQGWVTFFISTQASLIP